MEEVLVVGDVVVLKSGVGPVMTVSRVNSTTQLSAEVMWFDGPNLFKDNIYWGALKKYVKPSLDII